MKVVVWRVTIHLYNIYSPFKYFCSYPRGEYKAHRHPFPSLLFSPSTFSLCILPTFYPGYIHPCKWPDGYAKGVVDEYLPYINITKPQDMSIAIQDFMNIRHPKIRCPQVSVQPESCYIMENPDILFPRRHIKIRCHSYHLTPSYVPAYYDLVYLLFGFPWQIRFLWYSLHIYEWGQQTSSHKKWCSVTHIELNIWLLSP